MNRDYPKFTLWLFAGLFLLLNCTFFLRYLWQHGEGGGIVLGLAITALGLTLGIVCLNKARKAAANLG